MYIMKTQESSSILVLVVDVHEGVGNIVDPDQLASSESGSTVCVCVFFFCFFLNGPGAAGQALARPFH